MRREIIKNIDGQSLIEGIAAIGIIVFALVGIIALTLYNLVGQRVSEESFIASNLAREGIEVVRNLRDNVWVGAPAAISTGNHLALPIFNSGSNSWSLSYNSGLNLDNINTRVYLKNNLYVHDASGLSTKFNRLLTIDFVCESGAVRISGSCPGGDPLAGYRVRSEVKWKDKSARFHLYSLTDYLYDWK